MAGRTDYTVEKINEQIYRINEFNIMNCFLIIGEEKALLVDCGVGAGNMAEFVKTLTDKPVILAATHAHVDHIGAAWQFGKIYIHKGDAPIVWYQSSTKERVKYLKRHPSTEKFGLDYNNFAPQKSYLIPVTFGDKHKFDLGGITVEAVHTPGHSRGSVNFKIDKYNIMLVADNYISILNCRYAFAAPLSHWLKSAKAFLPVCEGYTLYGGHGQHPISPDVVKWLVKTVEDIIASTKKNDSFSNKKVKAVEDENGKNKVIYRTDMIL